MGLSRLLSDLYLLGKPSPCWLEEELRGETLPRAVQRVWEWSGNPFAVVLAVRLSTTSEDFVLRMLRCLQPYTSSSAGTREMGELIAVILQSQSLREDQRDRQLAQWIGTLQTQFANSRPSVERYLLAALRALLSIVEWQSVWWSSGTPRQMFPERELCRDDRVKVFVTSLIDVRLALQARLNATTLAARRIDSLMPQEALDEWLGLAAEIRSIQPGLDVAKLLEVKRLKSADGVEQAAAIAHLLRPSRPKGWDIVCVLKGETDPSVAWESLASQGYLPMEWLDDSARRFVHGTKLLPHPPTVAGCAAVAADVGGILTAETLARDLLSRRIPEGKQPALELHWQVETRSSLCNSLEWREVSTVFGWRQPRIVRAIAREEGMFRALVLNEPWLGPAYPLFFSLLSTNQRTVLERDDGQLIRDPWDALRALLQTGYTVMRFTKQRLVLGAPVPESFASLLAPSPQFKPIPVA